jgi:hypothetical protein
MKKTIEVNNLEYKIISKDLDKNIDIDNLLKIDLSNVVGEIVNFPVIVNKFGIMVANKEREISELKITIDVLEAQLKEELRNKHEADGIKPPTVEQLNTYASKNDKMQEYQLYLCKITEERDILQSTMWCARDKSGKLDKISLSLMSDDIKEYNQKINEKKKLIK